MEEFVKGAIAAYRGVVQGVYYGTKIRLPHAAVMTILFQNGTLREKALSIAWLSFQHARNLAAFVGIYKSSLAVLRLLDSDSSSSSSSSVLVAAASRRSFGVAARPLHALAAGALGGYAVWANYSSVNFQIVLYLFSRVAVALVRLAAEKQMLGDRLSALDFDAVYPYLATGTWALVLWLYEFHGSLLHPSLESSMKTLYAESNSWRGISDFVPSPAAAAVGAYLITSLYWSGKPLGPLFDLSKTKL